MLGALEERWPTWSQGQDHGRGYTLATREPREGVHLCCQEALHSMLPPVLAPEPSEGRGAAVLGLADPGLGVEVH